LGRVLFECLALPPDIRLQLAFSGGLDSTALLQALVELRDGAGGERPGVSAVHVNHGLQPAATVWARHCQEVCDRLQVPCRIETITVEHHRGEGPEAAARRARYQALARDLAPGEVLLTAHHRDDQAETVLLQLLRGAGVQGLAAMPAIAPFAAGRLARPLLDFSRAALRTYAVSRGLNWVEDASNRDPRLRRNLIRQQWLPSLAAHWPQAATLLARSARHAAEAAGLLDEIARLDLEACRLSVTGAAAALSVPALRTLSPARLRNLLRYWLRSAGFRAPASRRLEELIAAVNADPQTRHAQVSWPGLEVRRYRDGLYALEPLAEIEPPLDLPWDLSAPIVLPQLGWRLTAEPISGQGLSRARLAERPLRLRLRQGGERCRLPGQRHHCKLKKLLQAEGVAPWLRLRLPLLYAGEDLAAVADLWVCQPYAAFPHEPGLRLVLQRL
jgi:tRNA(Ile)-lysidine synthase